MNNFVVPFKSDFESYHRHAIHTTYHHIRWVCTSPHYAYSETPTPIRRVPQRASLSRVFLCVAAVRVSVRKQPRTITDNRSVGRSRGCLLAISV